MGFCAQKRLWGAATENTKTYKRAFTVAQIVLAVAIVAGLAWLGWKVALYYQGQQTYNDIRSAYAASEEIDFDALTADYPNAVAWIHLNDVDIDYPVMQGEDNDFYLHNNPSGQYLFAGSIFLDYRNVSLGSDLYALIYGHNMRDGSMFGKLQSYTDQSFYEQGSGTFWIATPKGTYYYQIFAVNIVDPEDAVFTAGYTNKDVFAAFVQNIKSASMYETGVAVSGAEQVVTLSTCSNSNRLVVSAKRISQDEANALAAGAE